MTDDVSDPLSDPLSEPPPPKRRRRWLRRIAWLPVLAAGGWAAWYYGPWWSEEETAPKYELAAVERGDVVTLVTASGTLNPVVQVEVGSQVSGRIRELFVDYNDTVTEGQLLATIDPEILEGAVRQAEAKLEAARADLLRAQAQLSSARAKYQRMAGLEDTGAVAAIDVEVARADRRAAEASVAAAEASVTLAEANVTDAQANLSYSKIYSPTDGVVVSVSVDVGQTVAASLSAPTLFVIAEDLRKMEVHTNVAESDVGEIEPGQAVEFTVDAYPERTFTGTVRQVRYEAQTVSNVVTYNAVITVANDDLKLRPGMTANVSFILEQRRGVLTVPAAAFRYRPAGARARPGGLWVLREGGVPTAVAVRAGLTDGSLCEVLGTGLREGDQVVLGDGSAATAAAGAGGADQAGGTAGGGRRRSGGGGPPAPPGLF
ncbi:MAG: efflux RND transporter periplasmic adaptor subunit [Deltaproteobacteria bacterium]|nr:efflux RND transporter periplasmic adaptor subunit [Deltaproteobacteria bacterium]